MRSKMIKIISFKICPFVQRVTALLEAKNTPYDLEYISLKNKPQWFLKLSPTGQVPVLISDSGKALFESDAIMEYIDEITQALNPALTAEQRAIERAWAYQASKHYLVQCSAMRSADNDTLALRTEKLSDAFQRVEVQLGDGPFFNGYTLGNVDLAWMVLLYRAAIIEKHTCYDFVGKFPKVKAWQKSLLETGIAEQSVANDFEKAFTDFYLSYSTYLGSGESCVNDSDTMCKLGSCC